MLKGAYATATWQFSSSLTWQTPTFTVAQQQWIEQLIATRIGEATPPTPSQAPAASTSTTPPSAHGGIGKSVLGHYDIQGW